MLVDPVIDLASPMRHLQKNRGVKRLWKRLKFSRMP